MKFLIRIVVFVIISLSFCQYVMKSIDYGSNPPPTFLLVVATLSILYLLVRPILKIISLPSEGFGYVFLLFVLTFAVMFVLTMFIPSFSIKATTLSGLNIFGFMLPSKSLTSVWAAVFSALTVGVTYSFLQGLCSKK